MAAPSTGVISASIRMTRKSVIDKNGIKTRRFLRPGADKVRRVISRLVKEIVVLTPESMTLIIAMSCAPNPVNRVLLENGVINVQPAIVRVELLDLGKDFFFALFVFSCVVMYHIESETFVKLVKNKFFIEKSKNLKPLLVSVFFTGVKSLVSAGFVDRSVLALSKPKPDGCFIKLK